MPSPASTSGAFFDNPTHDWHKGSAFHLFNAATFTLAGRVAENPALTRTLHEVIDQTAEPVEMVE